MNPSSSSMNVYKVSEDGGSFRLPGLEKLPWKWLLEVKTFSTIYPEGYYLNMRGKYDTRFFSCDIVCHTPHGLYLQITSLVTLQCYYF